MLEPLAGLLLTKEEYASLAPATAYREQVFPTWIEWNKLQLRSVGAMAKNGAVPEPWTIDINAFHDWCIRMGATPCIDELRIYCKTPGAKLPR